MAPFGFAALFALSGRTTAALVIGAIASILLLVRLVRPAWAHVVDRRLLSVGTTIARVVSFALLGLLFALVLVPGWAMTRLLGWSPLSFAEAGGHWRPAMSNDGGLVRRLFQREVGPLPITARLHGALVALVLVATMGGVAYLGARTWVAREPAGPEPGSFLTDGLDVDAPGAGSAASAEVEPIEGPVYEDEWTQANGIRISEHSFPDEPWAAEVLAEQYDREDHLPTTVSDPAYGWRNFDVSGTYHNVDGGVRRTLMPSRPVDATVWMFGGSTTYGIGQRDEHTIASDLVREARADGRRVEVVNFGVSAYVNAQESDLFAGLLADRRPPDAAIFLDGCNEWGVAYEREVYGLLDGSEDVTLAAGAGLQEERRRSARERGWVEEHDGRRQSRLMATQYRRGVERARRLAEQYEVPVVHFWQPVLETMPTDAPMMATVLANVGWDASAVASVETVYREGVRLAAVDVVDLTDALDDADEPTFFDFCHTNEAGARMQAEAIWPHVQEVLEAG